MIIIVHTIPPHAGYHLGILNTSISAMARQWGIPDVSLSPYATSALLVGAAVGCLLGGGVADAIGPRHALFYNNIVLLLGTLACVGAGKPLSLCFGMGVGCVVCLVYASLCTCTYMPYTYAYVTHSGRVIAGLGCGAASLFVPRYIAEVAPPDVRGALGTMTQVCRVKSQSICRGIECVRVCVCVCV